jgi:hypothetical protein
MIQIEAVGINLIRDAVSRLGLQFQQWKRLVLSRRYVPVEPIEWGDTIQDCLGPVAGAPIRAARHTQEPGHTGTRQASNSAIEG